MHAKLTPDAVPEEGTRHLFEDCLPKNVSFATRSIFEIVITKLFSVRSLMYGFGDDHNPANDAVNVMEEILIEYITDVVSVPTSHLSYLEHLRNYLICSANKPLTFVVLSQSG